MTWGSLSNPSGVRTETFRGGMVLSSITNDVGFYDIGMMHRNAHLLVDSLWNLPSLTILERILWEQVHTILRIRYGEKATA